MTDKILTTSLESANSALELANIAIEKLKAELEIKKGEVSKWMALHEVTASLYDKLKAEREALKAELDDHCQQLRKEQLAVQSLHEKLAEQTGLVKTTWEQLEHRQRINDDLLAKLEELEAHTKTLTQAAYAARLERDVAWQRCKELEAQEPKDGNSIHTLEQEPVAWGQPDAERNIVDTVTADDKAQAHDGWANQYTVPLYKRGTP